MLQQMFQELVKGVMPGPNRPPEQVVIEIPADHPKAAQLLALAKALASRQQLPSGVTVMKLARPGAADEFLEFLRVFGVDPAEILASVRPQPTGAIDPLKLLGLACNAGQANPLMDALRDGRVGR